MDTLKEVKMNVPSIIDLIIRVRLLENHGATFTSHRYSNARATIPLPCADKDIVRFVQNLIDKVGMARLTIGIVNWEEEGNCDGDELHDSEIFATKIPGDRYFIEVKYFNPNEDEAKNTIGFQREEYIWQAVSYE